MNPFLNEENRPFYSKCLSNGGRSMGSVLREVAALFPELNFETE